MEFYDRFKAYSNTDLLRIINNPVRYEIEAVETAKTLFFERELSDEEIKVAEEHLKSEKKIKLKNEQIRTEMQNNVRQFGLRLIENVNPIQIHAFTTDKKINIVSTLFAGLFLYGIYKEFGLLIFMLTDSSAHWDLSMVFYFVFLAILPAVAISLFYKRRKYGWLFMTILLTSSAVSATKLFILFKDVDPSSLSALDHIFPQTSQATHVFNLVFYTLIIYIICGGKIRKVFSIDRQTMVLTIGITALIVWLIYN